MSLSSGSGRRRIAIVAPSAYPLGGVQTWLDYLVPGLEDAGWDVRVLLVNGPLSKADRYLQRHAFAKVGLVTNQTGSREGRVRALVQSIRSASPDLVLVVNIADAYEAVSRIRNVDNTRPKIVMASHGLEPCFFDDLATLKSVIDGVISTNRLGVAAAVQMAGISATRACYAPCGVEVPTMPALDFSESDLTLLYAGRFDAQEKRIMDLPRILTTLEQRKIAYRLKLAGSGPAQADLIKALKPFRDKVDFVGVLDEGGLRRSFYRPGAILLIMSPSETGPLVAWEAMAHGVALVTSRFIGMGMEGSLRDGENCMVFPVGDADMASVAIAKLADPLRREALIRAGYELVSQHYARNASVGAWDTALRHILGQPALPAAMTPPSPSSGRLDRVMGKRLAETCRRLLGIRFLHKAPGDEWPHSYASNINQRLRDALQTMDRFLGQGVT